MAFVHFQAWFPSFLQQGVVPSRDWVCGLRMTHCVPDLLILFWPCELRYPSLASVLPVFLNRGPIAGNRSPMKFWHYWKWSNFVRCQPVTVAGTSSYAPTNLFHSCIHFTCNPDLSSTSPNFLPDKQSHFKRVLTLWDLLAYSISSTVGVR